ncbi:MAG TPA: hypothetical protein PLQ36_00730 [Candidatus Gracilibacteria bacterium]|nr:hypothetical protein [Candidatus Gracilibacteria bacterium]
MELSKQFRPENPENIDQVPNDFFLEIEIKKSNLISDIRVKQGPNSIRIWMLDKFIELSNLVEQLERSPEEYIESQISIYQKQYHIVLQKVLSHTIFLSGKRLR